MIFERNCPSCSKKLVYSCNSDLNYAIVINSLCRSCASRIRQMGKKQSKETIKKRSISMVGKNTWMKGKKLSNSTKDKMSKSFKGRIFTDEWKNKLSKKATGKVISEETKEKMRCAALKRIEKQGRKRGYNFSACKYIDDFNNNRGYNFQHALNGGEVIVSGYCLDGYDKEKNIVFEYDEPKHHSPYYRQKDLVRQKNIIDRIHPVMFIRYDEKNCKLYDAITGKDV